MIGIWIALGVVILVLLFAISSYNRLVSLREQVRSAWAQIDVALKRRHDLIPNLVETVKGYATHERDTLERVIAARGAAVAASNPAQSAQAEGALSGALRQLMVVAEQYPDLKANQNFTELQHELTSTEDHIAAQRSQYNSLVASYNTSLLSVPNNLFAGAMGFTPQPLFELQDAAQREVPAVKF